MKEETLFQYHPTLSDSIRIIAPPPLRGGDIINNDRFLGVLSLVPPREVRH
jgi:hypothetical protein